VGFGCIWIVGLLVVFFVVANILGLSLVFLAYRSVLCFFCVWNEKSYSSKKKKKFVSFLSQKKKPMSYCAQS
jgi:type II secretory pathway component PulL